MGGLGGVLGARLARLTGCRRSTTTTTTTTTTWTPDLRVKQVAGPSPKTLLHQQQPADILVAGSVAVDLSCDHTDSNSSTPTLHTSNLASIKQSIGGVGHNVALAAHLAGKGQRAVKLCSLVGDDL